MTSSCLPLLSRPSRTRGLKLEPLDKLMLAILVASFTDAWIETWSSIRGQEPARSRPSRTRGLKHRGHRGNSKGGVASFTDAWIETRQLTSSTAASCVASFTDAWIETLLCCTTLLRSPVASFTDAWIETVVGVNNPLVLLSRPSRTRGLKHEH